MSPESLYLNWFFSYFIVLCFARVGESFLCAAEFCLEENAVCYNFQCLAACPSSTYVYKKNCVKTCPEESILNGKECVKQCPSEKPLNQNGHCQSQCTNGLMQHNDTCVIGCPADTFLHSNSCVDVCPYTHPYTLNRTIVSPAHKHQKITECVIECPDTTVKTTNSCLLQCPVMMILFNQSCVHECPLSHEIVLIRNTELNSIPTCVSHCPHSYFRFGKTCVTKCPQDTLISNDTCVNNCTHPFPFLCALGKCTVDSMRRSVTSKGQCLSNCPKNHFHLQKSCFKYCYLSPLPYNLNNTCVSSCPQNLTYMNGGDKHCVNQCPITHVVKFKDQCLTKCPINSANVNGTCYTQCPDMYPFRYEMNSYPFINARISCVKTCPSNTFIYEKKCLRNCPRDTQVIQNRTCLKNCTNEFPLSCIRKKCLLPYTFYKTRCLSKCPPDHKQYKQECFRYCFDTPFKYLDNGACVHECSKNLSVGYERQCVGKCPENTKQYTDSCVYACPRDTFPFNKVCITSCPPEFPYKYVKNTQILFPFNVHTDITCLKICPNHTVYYKHTCVTKCPNDWVIFNSSCIKKCPSTHPFIYRPYMLCVSERPKYAFEMNNSYYSYCPDGTKFTFNGTCYSKCPKDYPFSQYMLVNQILITGCVDICKNDTMLWNHTCVSKCPKNLLIFKKDCVESCPEDYPLIYRANRIFLLTPLTKSDEIASYCGRYCDRNVDLNNFSEPCIYKGRNEYNLIDSSCKANSDSFKRNGQTCTAKRLFEQNGTFFEQCPGHLKHTRGICVEDCPPTEPLSESKSRRCTTKCTEKQFLHKQFCVEECPSKTFIIDSKCMDIKKCPRDKPVSLRGQEGNFCLKQCPNGHFLDGNICVTKCTGKKVLDKTCTDKCPETHPFLKTRFFTKDIPECLQECPENYLGNVTSLKCIYNYACEGFVYDKRCYPRCPNHTITLKDGHSKKCYARLNLLIEFSIFLLIAMVPLLLCIGYMCLEKGTLTRCFQRFTIHIFNRNNGILCKDGVNEPLIPFDGQIDDRAEPDVDVEENISRDPREISNDQSDVADRVWLLQDTSKQGNMKLKCKDGINEPLIPFDGQMDDRAEPIVVVEENISRDPREIPNDQSDVADRVSLLQDTSKQVNMKLKCKDGLNGPLIPFDGQMDDRAEPIVVVEELISRDPREIVVVEENISRDPREIPNDQSDVADTVSLLQDTSKQGNMELKVSQSSTSDKDTELKVIREKVEISYV